MVFFGVSRFVGEKKAPALTVSQLRMLLDVILPLRRYTIAQMLALVS
jgi:hypothetical protein